MNTKEAKQVVADAGKSWEDFLSFMYGNTYGIDDDGQPVWYKTDVLRFVQNKPVID